MIEWKGKTTEIKNSIDRFNSRFEFIEERKGELETEKQKPCKPKNMEKKE